MNRHEAATLLSAASTIDQTMPAADASVLGMWAAMLDDVPAEVGQAAVRAYYRSDAYADHKRSITPADIVSFWKSHRREQRDRQITAEITASRAAIEAAPHELPSLSELFARFNAERKGEDPDIAEGEAAARRLYMDATCPHCKAGPGQRCTGFDGRPLRKSPAHPARMAYAHG